MKALFVSKNLLGDGLNIAPALRTWMTKNPDYWVTVYTNNDSIADIYGHMGVTVSVNTEYPDDFPYDVKFDFDVSIAFAIGEEHHCHIAEAYARMLDIEIDTVKPTFIPIEEDHASNLILIAPFSKSCSVHTTGVPNKSLPWHKWDKIIEYLRTMGQIGILGSKGDTIPGLKIDENEYYCGLPLNKVALMLRDCKFLVSIDNGISHLAASQETPHVLMYPKCLSTSWAFPHGNPHVRGIHMDPNTIQPGTILRKVKEETYNILKGTKEWRKQNGFPF